MKKKNNFFLIQNSFYSHVEQTKTGQTTDSASTIKISLVVSKENVSKEKPFM